MTDGAALSGYHTRLTIIFLLSLAVHVVVLLALGFSWRVGHTHRIPPPIEVTLAQRPQETPPQQFDYLAQANQNGGGESRTKPTAPQHPPKAPTPPPSAPESPPKPKPSAEPQKPAPVKTVKPPPSPKTSSYPAMADIVDTSARVAARRELSHIMQSVSADYPSEQRIDARTHSHAAAEYMRQWVEKVERIGNLNYPREARRRRLSGRLILEVALRPDGSVYSVNVLVPSPFHVLNEAAERIVKLAEPYARIPKAVLQGRDLLVITRSWEFDEASHFNPQ